MDIRVGDKAPDFTLLQQDGTPVTLSALYKRGPVVLYFYPKDETTGCTAEACSFRDAYEDFKAAGAEVVGVSADSAASHASFAKHHRLPFVLLADPEGKAATAYGVRHSSLVMLRGRVTFVIDQRGVVQQVFESRINMQKHVTEALAALRRMTGAGSAASAP